MSAAKCDSKTVSVSFVVQKLRRYNKTNNDMFGMSFSLVRVIDKKNLVDDRCDRAIVEY